MKSLLLSFALLSMFTVPFMVPSTVMAADPPAVTAETSPSAAADAALQQAHITNPLGTSDVRVLIGRVIKVLLGLSGGLALLMFIWGGLLWMTSQGEKGRIEKGQKTLTWAAIGLVVLFTAYALVNLVISTLTSATGPTT